MNPTATHPAAAAAAHPTPPPPVRVDPAIIHTQNLCVRYNSRPALTNVTLPIQPGRITALIGPSGCGKTTFLNCLNRLTDLIPGCTVTGKITFAHQDILSPQTDTTALRRQVGMIFQKPNPFPMSIRRNIELPLKEHGMRTRAQLDHTVETALREVGLWAEVDDRLNAPALSLSGGQQQRLCIARALALKPQVILLDEPCSSLDPIASGVVEDLITSLRPRYTVVIVTHNIAQARRTADHTAFFWHQNATGRLIEHNHTQTLFHDPQNPLTAAYLTGSRG